MRRVRVVVNMVPQHVFVHNASDIITVQEICELSYRSFVVVFFFLIQCTYLTEREITVHV